ncbi:MAG TPA: hypothetical protein VF575_00455 [Candidatus Saccharimonadales bacterium]
MTESTLAEQKQALVQSEQLFLSLAEQMKLPLLQILKQAELGVLIGNATEHLQQVQVNADVALKLIDGYLLSMRLAAEESYDIEQESVSISSVLYDTAHQLHPIAKLYGVSLELSLGGKYGPVTAHREGLQSALVTLGYALIEALPATNTPQLKLELAAHRCRYGIVAGLYADVDRLTAEALRQGRRLVGDTRQPLPALSHCGGAGVFVADAILNAIGARLKVSHHNRRSGLGTVLQANPQLQLI